MGWLKKLFSTDNEASAKRFVCVLLVVVIIIALFLLMYIKIELANKDLVGQILDSFFWLILIFGGFITAEPVLSKLKFGKTTIQQDVQQQTVNVEKQEVKNE